VGGSVTAVCVNDGRPAMLWPDRYCERQGSGGWWSEDREEGSEVSQDEKLWRTGPDIPMSRHHINLVPNYQKEE